MPRILSFRIHSFTHKLNSDAFCMLGQNGLNLNASAISENHFDLEVSDIVEPELSMDAFATKTQKSKGSGLISNRGQVSF